MNVFIIGATGLIGNAVASQAKQAGHAVSGLARSEKSAERLRERGIVPVTGDLAYPSAFLPRVKEADAVVFAASYDGDFMEAMRVLPAAVSAILGALEGTGKAFIYTSGVGVYGDTGTRAVDEEEKIDPDPAFAAWAQIEQKVLAAARRDIRAVVIRPAQVYGHGGSLPFITLLGAAKQSGSAVFVAEGENQWSTVHVDDLARLYLAALERAAAGTLFNGAAHPPVSTKAIAEAIQAGVYGMGSPRSLTLEEASAVLGPIMAAFLARNMRVSGMRAKMALGWEPQAIPILTDLASGSYALPMKPNKP